MTLNEAENPVFTKACRADGEEIFALYQSLADEKGVSAWNESYPAPENVRDDIENSSLYVMKIGGEIVSVCSLGDYEDNEFDLSSFSTSVRRWAELSRVGTLRRFHRQGLSSKLVRCALSDARKRGFDGVRLFVNEISPAAIAHYRQLGVYYCGRTSAYGHNFLCGEFLLNYNHLQRADTMPTTPILTTAELGSFPNVWLSENPYSVGLIDQSRLPNEEVRLFLTDAEAMFEAIYTLRVRGAPAIGIFAAYAIFVLSSRTKQKEYGAFYAEFKQNKDYLDSSRPTAVDLRKQLDRMERVVLAGSSLSVAEILDALLQECCAIQRENLNMLRVVSEFGLELLKPGDGVLTHCNAGPLAGSPGLGAILLAQERGFNLHAYVDETRPLLQGARLTAYELSRAGVDTTLICDNMAATVMSQGKVQAVFIGCDRVAKNGDTANKIGSHGAAIIAKRFGVPFYVMCPSSTIDPNCETGADIVIEERGGDEIAEKFYEQRMAPTGIKCFNPAFDVTPADLITAIVTEKGVCRAPYGESLRGLY